MNLIGTIQFCCYDFPPALCFALLSCPASHLLTQKNVFFDRSHFSQIVAAMLSNKDTKLKIDIPPPSIIKVNLLLFMTIYYCPLTSAHQVVDWQASDWTVD